MVMMLNLCFLFDCVKFECPKLGSMACEVILFVYL